MQQKRGNPKFSWIRQLARPAVVLLLFVMALQLAFSYNFVRRTGNRGWNTNNRAMPYYSPRRLPMPEPNAVDQRSAGPQVISVETALSKVEPTSRPEQP